MRAQVYNRDRFEVEGYTARMGWVAVRHCDDVNEAKRAYDQLAAMTGAGAYEKLRIRHRHIRESVQFLAPDTYEVVIAWCEGFEFMPTHHKFFDRARALAFAEDGNKPGVMASVHCVELATGRTIFSWKA